MVRYVAKRLAVALATIYLVITLTFFMIRLMPGSPMSALEAALQAQGGLTPAQIAAKVQQVYAVTPTGPLWKQYLQYITGLAHGNLGSSIIDPGQTVLSIIAGALPWTLVIIATSLLVSFAIGTVIGTLMSAFPASWFAKVVTGVVSFLSAVPNYIVALAFIYILADQDHLFPASGAYSLTTTPGLNTPFLLSVLGHGVLPIACNVVVAFGGWALTMKGSVSTVLGGDYLLAGEARGLSRRRLTQSYIGRNAMLPMVTNLAMSLGYMFGGSVFVETFFVYPGIGYYMIVAVDDRDYSLMMGCFLLITVAIVLANLIVDFVYPLVDPRIISPAMSGRASRAVSGRTPADVGTLGSAL